MPEKSPILSLFAARIKVINVGIEKLVDHFKGLGVEFVQVDWKPPASTNPEILEKLKSLTK